MNAGRKRDPQIGERIKSQETSPGISSNMRRVFTGYREKTKAKNRVIGYIPNKRFAFSVV